MQLVFAALIPLLLSVLFYYLKNKSKFGSINPILLQFIVGIIFGLSAVYATELGSIKFMGAIINVRDASPALAGIIFGPIAGITSGLIGAFDRCFIAMFLLGTGSYTVWACAIAVFSAGLIGGIMHLKIFKNRKPYLLHCFIFIMILEVCHMWLIALFHLWDLEQAVLIMNKAFLPVLVINTLSVVLTILLVSILDLKLKKISLIKVIKSKDLVYSNNLYYSFQFWLIISIIIAFIINSVIVIVLFNIANFNQSYARMNEEYNSFTALVEQDAKFQNIDYLSELQIYANNWSDDFLYKITIFDEYNFPLNSNKEITPYIQEIKKNPSHELFFINGDSNSYVVYYGMINNTTIVFYAYEMYEYFMSYLGQAVSLGFQILIFSVVLIIVFVLMKKLVSDNLDSVNKSLKEISDGNLEEKINIKSHTEFKMLSESINETVETLKEYINAESERYKEDLIMAQQIQLSALPSVFPPFPDKKEIDIFAKYKSTNEVGGDFYDYYFVDKDLLCFLIADVSGKGIPAAMFMMRAKTAIKVFAEKYKNPALTLKAANNYLCDGNRAELFVTCWICFFNIKTGQMQYASAGHNPPVILNTVKNEVRFLKSKISLVLGGMENIDYENKLGALQPNDKLLLYTDGITEAHNNKNLLFGDKRLLDVLQKSINQNVEKICIKLFNIVDDFKGNSDQFDDMTCLCFCYYGNNIESSLLQTELSIYSVLDNVINVCSAANDLFNKANVPKKIINMCNVAIDEIFSNIVNYGYANENNYITIKMYVDTNLKNKLIKITFIDSAEKFNPLDVSAPDTTLDADKREIGGLGIFIVREMMDEVFYEYKDNCNQLSFIKYF